MIYLIMGRTSTGKDTLGNFLKKEGISPIISKTTRKKRENENSEHIFVNEDDFKKDKENILVKSKIDDNYYYITKEMLKDDHYYIIDPEGAKTLTKITPSKNYYIFYLNVEDKRIREERFLNRDKTSSKKDFTKRDDNEDEIFRNFETSVVDESVYKDFGKNVLKINILETSTNDLEKLKFFAKEIKLFDDQFKRFKKLINFIKDEKLIKSENDLIEIDQTDDEGNKYTIRKTVEDVTNDSMYDPYLLGTVVRLILANNEIDIKKITQ